MSAAPITLQSDRFCTVCGASAGFHERGADWCLAHWREMRAARSAPAADPQPAQPADERPDMFGRGG